MIRRAFGSPEPASGLPADAAPGVRVDPDEGPVERHRVAGGPQVLRPQGPALGGGDVDDGRGPGGRRDGDRVAAGVDRRDRVRRRRGPCRHAGRSRATVKLAPSPPARYSCPSSPNTMAPPRGWGTGRTSRGGARRRCRAPPRSSRCRRCSGRASRSPRSRRGSRRARSAIRGRRRSTRGRSRPAGRRTRSTRTGTAGPTARSRGTPGRASCRGAPDPRSPSSRSAGRPRSSGSSR